MAKKSGTPNDLRTNYLIKRPKRPDKYIGGTKIKDALPGELGAPDPGYNKKTGAEVIGWLRDEDDIKGGSFVFVESEPKKDGKMENFPHILNVWGREAQEFCLRQSQIAGQICQKCYFVMRDLVRHDIIGWRAWANAKAVAADTEPKGFAVWPPPNDHLNYCRINSTGEMGTVKECVWVFRTILANPGINFGWWTKRPDLIHAAMKEMKIEKPANVKLIKSSFKINVIDPLPAFFDRVFTVFDAETLEKKKAENATKSEKEEKFEAVCQGQHCFACLICYKTDNKRVYINEEIQ